MAAQPDVIAQLQKDMAEVKANQMDFQKFRRFIEHNPLHKWWAYFLVFLRGGWPSW